MFNGIKFALEIMAKIKKIKNCEIMHKTCVNNTCKNNVTLLYKGTC